MAITRTCMTARVVSCAALAGVLAACSPGGNVAIGSGQKPDPATVDFPIAYVKKTIPDFTNEDLRDMRTFFVDAEVYVRDRADSSVPETNITASVTNNGQYDIRDLDVSFDGTKLAFAMRGPFVVNGDEEDQPKWAIWEYSFTSKQLRRVIGSNLSAAEGHDVAPHYLPSGDIVFTSTRQRASKAVLIDEGKAQFEAQTEDRREPAFVLHAMRSDGGNQRQISFNQSHDMDPTVLQNGRILWSRWDAFPGRNGIHLYSANPDGTDLQLLYGALSHLTGTNNTAIQFTKPREMPNGEILALARPFNGTDTGGDIVLIDTRNYVENTQPLAASPSLTGPAQRIATGNDVRTVPGLSPGGRFSAAFPLWDGSGRIAVSWTQCRAQIGGQLRACTSDVLADPAATEAPPLYSLWMYDTVARAFLPLQTPEPGVMITDVVIAQPRTLPAVVLDKQPGIDLNADWVSENVGVLDIRSVYDLDGVDSATPNIATLANPALRTAAQRPARFLRIEKAVSLPDDQVRDIDQSGFGASNFMREIIGYVPVEPDGSVRAKVPANVALIISALDQNARRITPVHRNWLQVRPGEVRSCNGCHVPNAQTPKSHGRTGLFNSIWAGGNGGSFPGADPTLTSQSGETMAQTRARITCALGGQDKCKSMLPSVDVVFDDAWTDPVVSGRAKDASFAWRYADLTTLSPTSLDCATRWSATCRIVINYQQMLHPLWSKPRLVGTVDRTCTSCHSPRDAANAIRVPAGQLDLSDGPADDDPDQFKSYRELLFTDNAQEVNMGALQDIQVVVGTDPVTGLPITQGVPVPASMAAGSARGSARFFSRMDPGGSHAGDLNDAERRLLSEWLDIGAQYYNNPFLAPVN